MVENSIIDEKIVPLERASNRLGQLDSLRGLAAMSVLIGHYLNILPVVINATYDDYSNWTMILLKFTPLHIIWAGHEAVIFFFVLSGFVLTLPFLKEQYHTPYKVYLMKRICRIYIPYLVALLVAIVCNVLLYKGENPNLSILFNMVGQKPTDIHLVLQHLLLIGSFPNFKFNPVLWSLVQEMRISILFPLIAFFVIRYNWKVSLFGGGILSVFAVYMGKFLEKTYEISVDYNMTFHYMGMFIVGAILAKHRHQLIQWVGSFAKWKKYCCLLVAILLYTYNWWFYYFGVLRESFLKEEVINDWVITVAVAIFVFLSLSSKQLTKILLKRSVHFLGKISYSLYLYHFVVLIAFINLFYHRISLGFIVLGSFLLGLLLSTLSYYYVEEPSMKLGKYLEKFNPFLNKTIR